MIIYTVVTLIISFVIMELINIKHIKKSIRQAYGNFGNLKISKRTCVICFKEMRDNSRALKYMENYLDYIDKEHLLKHKEIQKILIEHKLKEIN